MAKETELNTELNEDMSGHYIGGSGHGTIVGVGTGEIIPADRVVVKGMAWVKFADELCADADGGTDEYLDTCTLGKGRRVHAGDVVQVGELHIYIAPDSL